MLDDLLADCQGPEDILGESGLLKQLSQMVVERALTGELNHHLAHDEPPPDANSERRNSRNGYSKKTVQSTQGDLDLSIPRDCNGDFEPILVPKHQRRLSGFGEKILALYARSTSTRDISAQAVSCRASGDLSASPTSRLGNPLHHPGAICSVVNILTSPPI
jgi:putative transposase